MTCQLRACGFALLLALMPTLSPAQAPSRADSILVRRILAAEDARDSLNPVFAQARQLSDERIRLLARRAEARIRDPKFAARDSLPKPAAPPAYPDAPWRLLRYRTLGRQPLDCSFVTDFLNDQVTAVVLRAIDVMTPECSRGNVETLRRWADSLPARGGTWHRAAHSIVALARVSPSDARSRLSQFTNAHIPSVRAYAARAAGVLADTATLRALAADPNDNVKEVAIDELSRVAGHSADATYLNALTAHGYQAVRAAARALKGTPNGSRAFWTAEPVFRRITAESSETSRDARMALLELMGQSIKERRDTVAVAVFATDFDCAIAQAAAKLANVAARCHPMPSTLPSDAVAFALGKETLLRVTLADSTGGGAFTVRLRGDVAPIMAARVLDLVRSGWYNNRAWYRVEPDFVIQGGGPGSNEYVGHPRFMRDELSAIPQVRGTVGMSTRGHDTGDAQWFINLRDNPRLTRDYTTFGEVVDGIDVVDRILEGTVIQRIEVVTPSATPR